MYGECLRVGREVKVWRVSRYVKVSEGGYECKGTEGSALNLSIAKER